LASLAALLLSGPCAAQSVTLAGSMGADRALLLIDGQPRTVAVGSTVQGVLLRRLADGQAEVVVDGRALTLRLGDSPARLGGGAAAPASTEIVLAMGPGGHFGGQGTINGKSVQFLVDTGATTIALSQAEANRIGLDWKRGKPGLTATANGPVPVYAINLSAVRLGGVEVANVAAIVLPAEMPMVLLGNSFLGRFSMRQDGDVMRLDKKP
jgi:aspartyl protease family protein